MKIGMCLLLWTTRVGPEHEALLADIRATGFDGVEVPVFKRQAIRLCPAWLLTTMDDLAGFVRRVGHPNIRAMYDTFHANIEEADPIGALTRNRAEVVHIHISENDRGVPGRGNIPWAETFAAIRDIGYDDWLTIESFGRGLPDPAAATKVWRDFAESPEAIYQDGFAHIVKHLQKVGLR